MEGMGRGELIFCVIASLPAPYHDWLVKNMFFFVTVNKRTDTLRQENKATDTYFFIGKHLSWDGGGRAVLHMSHKCKNTLMEYADFKLP
jgi:hypothetical protein